LLILLLPSASFAQAQRLKDTIQLALDTIKQYRYVPTGVRIGTDVISLIKTQTQKDFSGWEANADVDFYRYYLAIDYGRWARNFSDDSTSTYSNKGTYWRVGADVNFLLKDPDRNMFFLGLRYGHSSFSEKLALVTEDPLWGGPFILNFENNNMKAHWLELTTGLKVKMWKMIWMGYTARFKFGLSTDKNREMLPHDVPGYGRTDKETAWGFNYQIFVRIPFRRTLTIPELPK
jgi:hypothetical protein